VLEKVQPLFLKDLLKVIPEWGRLMKVNGGEVAVHSLLVLYLTMADPVFQTEMNDEQRNVLMWTALLHDISKRGLPELVGKDHTHPFTGGALVLKIFYRLGLITCKKTNLDLVIQKIEYSVRTKLPANLFKKLSTEAKSNKICNEIHNHKQLDNIFKTLWSSCFQRGLFSDLVFRLTFFHQSLHGIAEWPPMVESTP
jgi:hypothetical protein